MGSCGSPKETNRAANIGRSAKNSSCPRPDPDRLAADPPPPPPLARGACARRLRAALARGACDEQSAVEPKLSGESQRRERAGRPTCAPVPTSADKSSELMKKYLHSRAAGAMRAFAL